MSVVGIGAVAASAVKLRIGRGLNSSKAEHQGMLNTPQKGSF